MVGKIETQQRESLLPSIVRDLISVKVNYLSHVNCHTVTFPPALVKGAKTATMRKLADAGEELMSGLSDPLFFIFLFTFLITFSYKCIDRSSISEKSLSMLT